MIFKKYLKVAILFTIIGIAIQTIFIDYFGYKAWLVLPIYSILRFFARYNLEKNYVFNKKKGLNKSKQYKTEVGYTK